MDRRATEELAAHWTASQRTVAAFIGTLITDFHDAEDVLQRVAVALVRKFDDYDPARPFVAWALGIAKLEVLYFRRQQAMDRLVLDDELLEQVAQSYERIAQDAGPIREALRACMEKVDGRARQALELRYAEGVKPARIAERMQLSSGSVRMLLCRVRAAIRDCVQRRIARSRAVGGAGVSP